MRVIWFAQLVVHPPTQLRVDVSRQGAGDAEVGAGAAGARPEGRVHCPRRGRLLVHYSKQHKYGIKLTNKKFSNKSFVIEILKIVIEETVNIPKN